MKKVFLLSAMALFAVACNKTNNPNADGGKISFAPSVSISNTKGAITATSLPTGGALGVYASKYLTSVGHSWNVAPYIANNLLVYGSAQTGTFETTPNAYFWPTTSETSKMNFYAYFDPSRSIPVSQTSGSTPTAAYTLSTTPASQIDFLWANPVLGRDGTEANPIVPLVLNHALSQLHFTFKSTVMNAKLVSVKLNTPTAAVIDITNGSLSGVGTASDITINTQNFGTTATPISAPVDNVASTEFFATMLIPNTIPTTSTFDITYTYTDIATGGTITSTATLGLASALDVMAGNIYTIGIELTQNSIIFQVPTITPWVDVNGGAITIQ
ncbi:MAG: fimbrillin family protein [Flavobacteriales bacterium]|nr:fimbrillin family protein [Flavobacteriales bacterium]